MLDDHHLRKINCQRPQLEASSWQDLHFQFSAASAARIRGDVRDLEFAGDPTPRGRWTLKSRGEESVPGVHFHGPW